MLPTARRSDLIVRELGDELVVYDRASLRVHRLNRTAAAVWRLCDGTTTVEEMARRLGDASGPLPEDVVRLALAQLERIELIRRDAGAALARLDRRTVVRRLGRGVAAALLLPAVSTITAPSAAMAATPGAPAKVCERLSKLTDTTLESAGHATREAARAGAEDAAAVFARGTCGADTCEFLLTCKHFLIPRALFLDRQANGTWTGTIRFRFRCACG
jgi:hypothetical protein